ncbi:DUF6119 family protein [uncultured Methanobrevibacter sp.]|uniref:DUF6119 family protein n=1 Tax=uncultured Methanobrevibacter sp. TaxID=253161 RepID=UPI0025FBC5C2|nr:DUF6119 family protein [uncultured Methanobrevibacter sp.]
MSDISLYKINNISKLKSKLIKEGFEKKNNTKKVEIGEGKDKKEYLMEFYYEHGMDLNVVSWHNFAENFDVTPSEVQSNPRAVILIERDESYYAISFGTAYHYVEPLSDKQWAFNFAKRLNYDKINLMATTIPQSKLTKQISSYRNYNETDINVGEALSKITAYMEPDDELIDVGEKLQVGNSLKLKLEKDDLETVAKTISYIEEVISKADVLWEIPQIVEIKDEKELEKLNAKLKEEICKWSVERQKSNLLDVNNYVVYSNDFKNIDDFAEFQLKYKKKNSKEKAIVENYDDLSMATILKFISSNNIASDDVLDINIIFSNENEKIQRTLDKIIIYDCIDENCVYEYGKWSRYNQHYIDMVEKEIATIPAKFCPEYRFESDEYDRFITDRNGSNNKEYNETTFNDYLVKCHDFVNYDKELRRKKGYAVEIMDLYKDGVAYSVKKGSGSQKLSVVVDQSIEGMRFLIKEDTNFANKIETVCIWLILDRKKDIHDENNVADINELDMLMLKTKLVIWAQQMRLWGYKPVIQINYKKR